VLWQGEFTLAVLGIRETGDGQWVQKWHCFYIY
jgi:hypothetical protein